MKKCIRVIILISFIIIFGLLISGCQSSEAEIKTVQETSEEVISETVLPTSTKTTEKTKKPTASPTISPLFDFEAKDLEGTMIYFWHPWAAEIGFSMEQIVAKFNQENVWGITVRVQAEGGSNALFEKIKQNVHEGQLPHLTVGSLDQMLVWQESRDILVDINPYIHDLDWGLSSAELSDIPNAFWESDQFDEHQYAVPAVRDYQVLYYNQTWAKELGFDAPPTNLEEFRAQTCAASQIMLEDRLGANDGTGGWIVNMDPLVVLSWMQAFGVEGWPETDAGKYHFNSKEMKNMLSTLRELFDDGCIWISREPSPYKYFARREALIYSGSLQDISYQRKVLLDNGSADEWILLTYPTEKGIDPFVVADGASYAILESSPEEQLASWLFIRWLLRSENQVTIADQYNGLPVGREAASEMEKKMAAYKQWPAVLFWSPIAVHEPSLESWQTVRPILQDAFWQTFQADITPDNIPDILEIMDDTIEEVGKMD
ncbi:MAG: extracellular solute-binding protein [Anaerolineaceae bacterium]|nr:extracellular solute-binding protein [Anaerolineaceae bacterium]